MKKTEFTALSVSITHFSTFISRRSFSPALPTSSCLLFFLSCTFQKVIKIKTEAAECNGRVI